MSTAEIEVHRPLGLGEVLAAAVQHFGRRPAQYLLIGVVEAALFVLQAVLPLIVFIVVYSVAFAVGLALTALLVRGDGTREAVAQVGRAFAVLVPLGIMVAVPFYLLSLYVIMIVLGIAWLAFAVFAIPAATLEPPREAGFSQRLPWAVSRSATLARTNYLHALAVTAVLVVVQVVFSVVLGVALASFADNSRFAALAIAQVVLVPFFFLGLSVLYFEQRARAEESGRVP